MKKILYCLSFVFIWMGCTKDNNTAKPGQYNNGFFILNEGTFNFGNASLSFYNTLNDSVIEDVFKLENQQPLGDVAQSITKVGRYLLIAVNNSQKIEVLDSSNCKRIKTIIGFGSPRYIQGFNDSMILVTELYNKKLHLVNIHSGSIEQSFSVDGWGEKMITIGSQIIIQFKKHPTGSGTFGFGDFNIQTNALTLHTLTSEPLSTVKSNNQFWTIFQNKDSSYSLIGMNTAFKYLPLQFDFTKDEAPKYLTGDDQFHLYYLYKKQLFEINLAESFPKPTLIKDVSHLQNIYQLQYYHGKLVVFDAMNYTSKGKIEMYDVTGKLYKTIQTGIIPNAIL